MTNALTGNPITVDTAATVWAGTTGVKYVTLMQWVDDAADIANDSSLVLSINGVTVTGKVQLEADKADNVVVWEMNFGGSPMKIDRLTVTTIDAGLLVIWLD